MQINSLNPLNKSSVNFKGYDALPLKNIYISEKSSDFFREIKAIGKKEGFDTIVVPGRNRWIQDHKIIIDKNNKPHEIAMQFRLFPPLNEVTNEKIENTQSRLFEDGGDVFIGKHPDGKKWMMVGEDIVSSDPIRLLSDITRNLKQHASLIYDVCPENIYFMPRPNFHLDMGIRPIGDNDVLVNDYSLVVDNLKKINDGSGQFKEYLEKFDKYKKEMEREYATSDEICEVLKRYGFNPIKIAGVYGKEVNFMNAIVNKHSDNSISYITNSSICDIKFYKKMQELFEKDLREKTSKTRDVYFVKGDSIIMGNLENLKFNSVMKLLENYCGGIHCMTLEEPDFDKWV